MAREGTDKLSWELRCPQHALANLFIRITQSGAQSFLDNRVIEGHLEHLLDGHV